MINTKLRWNNSYKESYSVYVSRKIKQYGIVNFKIQSRKGKYRSKQIIYYMSEKDWEKIMEDLK